MECYCCGDVISLARKAKLRIIRNFDPEVALPGTAAYQSYEEETTFHWAVACLKCHRIVDNEMGSP